jgi:hypothetical protein
MFNLINSEHLFNLRSEFLRSLVADKEKLEGERLIQKHIISNGHFLHLQAACFNYLLACLAENGIDVQSADSYDDFVLKNSKSLSSMVNVTPNGVIRPKKETISEFNSIHHALSNILDSIGIKVNKIRAPISIRIVTSHDNQEIMTRPRANNKLHSDFWTGAVCDLAILIPVFGNLDAVDVVFGEPKGMSTDFLQEVADYANGSVLYNEFVEYQTVMEKGYLFFQDIFCLHGTRRRGIGCRISIDFTVQSFEYEKTIKPFYSNKAIREDNHIGYDQWKLIGQNNLIYETESIKDLLAKNDYYKMSEIVGKGVAVKHQTSKSLRLISMDTFHDLMEFESRVGPAF